MAELTVEVRGSNGAFYKVRAAGRPGRELGIGSGGRGRRGPRGPRHAAGGGGGQRVRAAGVCPRRGLTVSGARAPLCLETRRQAPALPAARERRGPRPPGRGRPGRAGLGRAGGAGLGCGRAGEGLAGRGAQTAAGSSLGPRGGWACGAPVRLARGVVADPEAHPGVAPPRGPANPWRPRGERAGRGACGLGSGRPFRRGERRLGKAGFKGDPGPGGRWEGRVSSQPAAKEVFFVVVVFLRFFFFKSFHEVLFVSLRGGRALLPSLGWVAERGV